MSKKDETLSDLKRIAFAKHGDTAYRLLNGPENRKESWKWAIAQPVITAAQTLDHQMWQRSLADKFPFLRGDSDE